MKKLILFLFTAVVLASCSSDSSEGQKDKYDRGAILQNWADNIIMPSLQNYNTRLAALKTTQTAFTTTPSETTLTDLQAKWLEAYKAYQHVAMFNIGKSDEIQFTKYTNTYPTNAVLIGSKITNGDTNIEGPGNDVVQGFPALDYLLFGLSNTTTGTLEFYTTNANAANYKNYLTVVTDKLLAISTTVLNDWQGGFKADFVSKTDNTAAGSVNKLVNAYVQFYEKEVRTGKVGIPAGKFSSTPLPEKVEGFYSKIYSQQLLIEGLKASQNFFNGTHFGKQTTGPSLKSYLDFLGSKGDNENAELMLSDLMNNQFITATTAISAMMPSLYDQVLTDNNKMLTSFDAMQRNVAYMKTDMVSALSISINYADTDGD